MKGGEGEDEDREENQRKRADHVMGLRLLSQLSSDDIIMRGAGHVSRS